MRFAAAGVAAGGMMVALTATTLTWFAANSTLTATAISLETGTPRVVYGNVSNDGLIDNLPAGCCVEVPCLVDKNGIQPTCPSESAMRNVRNRSSTR